MLTIDRILLPTDGSTCAEWARTEAQFLANQHGATLHVLHVDVRDTELSDVIEVRDADVLADLHRIDAAWEEEDAIAVPEPQVVQHTLAHPSAAGGILSYAVEHDVDLVVMGTHGRRGLQRVLLGSVAERVIRQSHSPVLAVRAPAGHAESDESDAARPMLYGQSDRVLVPVDFSAPTSGLVAHARAIALAYDTGIDLLFVVEPVALPPAYGTGPEPLGIDVDALVDTAQDRLDAVAEVLRGDGLDVRATVRVGDPPTQIVDAAREGIGLIAIATHGRSGVRRILLGSVAERVLRHAPCPVFVVKSFGKSIATPSDALMEALPERATTGASEA